MRVCVREQHAQLPPAMAAGVIYTLFVHGLPNGLNVCSPKAPEIHTHIQPLLCSSITLASLLYLIIDEPLLDLCAC